MNLVYGSVCSGIEAASLAWEPLGWRPKFFSEIEKFPSAVLAERFGSNMPGEPLSRNGVPNHGDFTTIGPDAGPIDLLAGGTPCQSFSVAGKRLGLDDPRGNLALEYLALARRLKPKWIVWENVPGAFSSRSGAGKAGTGDADGHDDGGIPTTSDFAAFLAAVRECGYGFAYRVLDAQYVRVSGYERAVPQRRRRLFLVGYLGDWRPAAAALFEPEGVPGHPEPRRTAGQGAAWGFAGSLRSGGEAGGRGVSPAVSAKWAKGSGGPAGDETQNMVACAVADTLSVGANQTTGFAGESVAKPLGAKKDGGFRADLDNDTYVAHALRGEGFDASEDGTGRGTPIVAFRAGYQGDALVTPDMANPPLSAQGGNNGGGGSILVQPIAFPWQQGGTMSFPVDRDGSIGTMIKNQTMAIAIQERAGSENPDAGPGGSGVRDDGSAFTLEARQVPQAVAFQPRIGRNGRGDMGDAVNALSAQSGETGKGDAAPAVAVNDGVAWEVRRLTPRKCERLQGFPDDWTDIAWRGKPAGACPDGPRYKAIGNSMAVNVMRWIGERIDLFEKLKNKGLIP